MKRRLGISQKLIILYLIIAIPLIVVIGYDYLNRYQLSVDRALAERTEVAKITAANFILFTNELSRSMRFTGQAITENNYPPPRAALSLGKLLNDYPIGYAVYTDSTGTVIASTDVHLVGQNLAKHEAFKSVISGYRQTGIEPVSKTRDITGFYITQVIRGDDGTVHGVVGSFIDVTRLDSMLQVAIPSGEVNIIDANGHLVFQSDIPNLPITKPYWGKYGFVKSALSGSIATADNFVFPGNGEVRLVAEVPIRDFGWAAGSDIRVQEVLAPIKQDILANALATIAILLIALTIVVFIARHIISSLESLVNSARLVGEGRFDEPVILSTGDEIEDVARSLNEARINLKGYVEGLSDITETAGMLSSSLELERVKNTIISSAKQLFEALAVWVFIFDEETGYLESLFWNGLGAEELSKLKLRPGEGIIGTVFKTGNPIITQDIKSERIAIQKERYVHYGIKSAAMVPLIIGGRPFGVLGLFSPDTRTWVSGGRRMELFETFGSQVAISLENARLFDERLKAERALDTEHERLAVTLSSIGDGVIATDTEARVILLNPVAEYLTGWTQEEAFGKPLPEVFNIVNEETRRPADDPVARALRSGLIVGLANHTALIAKDGTGVSIADSCAPIRNSEGKILGTVLVFRDVTEERHAEEERKQLLDRLSIERSQLETIMESTNAHVAYLDPKFNFIMVNSAYAEGSGHTEEELIGKNHFDLFPDEENEAIFKRVRDAGEPVEFKAKPFLFADQPWRGVTYWDWTLTPIKGIAGNAIGLVLSLVDVTEAVRSKQLSDALNDINTAISSTFNIDEILQSVVVEAARAIDCDGSVIGLYEDDVWTIQYVHGLSETLINKAFRSEEVNNVIQALKTKKPTIINDTSSSKEYDWQLTEVHGVRSVMTVPLIVKDESIGTICFVYTSAPVAFTSDKVDFAKKLAASVSFALESAKLYAAERNIADTLQEAILTLPGYVEGVDFGFLYRSATEAAKVGGDFYDLFEIEPGKVGIIVGDVSGKGIEASAMTSFVKNTIRAHAQDENSPALVVAKTNDLVVKSSPESNFITLFFGILDTETGRVAYCNAGHPPAILIKEAYDTMLLTTESPLIGVFAGLDYDEREATLEKGDILVLYTDGIIEARSANNNELFGEDRLISFVEGLEAEEISRMPQLIFDYIVSYTGGKLLDDMVVLTIGLSGNSDGYVTNLKEDGVDT